MNQAPRLYLAHIVIGLGLIVFQSTLLAKLGGLNFLPVLIVYLGTTRAFLTGGLIVFFLGLILDLFSGASAGLDTGVFLVIYFAARLIHSRFHLDHPFHQMGMVFGVLVFHHFALAYSVTGAEPEGGYWINIGVTTLLSPALFHLFGLVEAWQMAIFKPRTAG